MLSVKLLCSGSQKVLRNPRISSTLLFESRCQYHHIKLHHAQLLTPCVRKSQRLPLASLSSRYISTQKIDSVESQDESVTQLYSKNIDKLSETDITIPADKSNIVSPELTENVTTAIPEPPMAKLAELLEELSKEPPIEDLGLGGWTPSGIVQQCLEFLHIGLDLPWWQAIIIATIAVRTLLFPLTIISQRNAAKMFNTMPEMQEIQKQMSDARQLGDNFETARLGQEMMMFMKKNDVNPLKNIAVPLLQAPIFISFFMGLRGMANVPVDSMKNQGLWWFTDLTMPDQFYILPIVTSLTLLASIELGAEGGPAISGPAAKWSKYILRGLPLVVFPFTVNFPGAILLYWCTSNFLTLCQVAFLKVPAVRTYFKIPARRIVTEAEKIEQKKGKKGFVAEIKESMANAKITREISDRSHLDEMQFNKAGRAALVKTYKFNPTLQRAQSTDTKSSSTSLGTPPTGVKK